MSMRGAADLNPMAIAGIDLGKVRSTKKLIKLLSYLDVIPKSYYVQRLQKINNDYRYHLFLKKST